MASRTDLALLIENRGAMLEECLDRVRSGDAGGGLFFDIAFHYRLLAIAHLLLHGDKASFGRHLQNCGAARLHWLASATGANDDDAAFRSRANDIAWDAFVAAGDIERARRTAELLPDHALPGIDYEEDFLWKRLLHTLLADDAAATVRIAAPLVDALRGVDSDTVGRKIAVATALVARDPAGWAAAFPAFVEARRTRFDELAATPGFSREHLLTERHVFLGGLAVNRVAQHVGLDPIDLPSLPAIACLPADGPKVPADAWLHFSAP